MNNAEKFQEVFGYYATEMWAKPEKEFLDWINEEHNERSGWIPVSKRLPDKDGWYLITVQGYEKVVDMEWYYSEWGAWNGVSSEQQVIAWMPLPEPYKDGDTE